MISNFFKGMNWVTNTAGRGKTVIDIYETTTKKEDTTKIQPQIQYDVKYDAKSQMYHYQIRN